MKAKKFEAVRRQHIKLKSVVSRLLFNVIICKWVKVQQLLALSEISKILSNILTINNPTQISQPFPSRPIEMYKLFK